MRGISTPNNFDQVLTEMKLPSKGSTTIKGSGNPVEPIIARREEGDPLKVIIDLLRVAPCQRSGHRSGVRHRWGRGDPLASTFGWHGVEKPTGEDEDLESSEKF